jgi:hypothetical protein
VARLYQTICFIFDQILFIETKTIIDLVFEYLFYSVFRLFIPVIAVHQIYCFLPYTLPFIIKLFESYPRCREP